MTWWIHTLLIVATIWITWRFWRLASAAERWVIGEHGENDDAAGGSRPFE